MKIKSDMRPVAGDQKHPSTRNGLVAARHPSPVTRHSENGIALVITLILLSVTLVMAIAFLAISRRERGSVTTSTDTVTARLAADAALANAQAQIVATILATGNPYDPSLIVSTNYINPDGFLSGNSSATNVSYDYFGGAPLNNDDFEQNVANLLYLPRAPVLVVTNRQTGAGEYRFYLDLNRNGQFEDTGAAITNVDNGNNILFSGGVPVVNNQTGDPQWIGVLERPDVTHGPNNKFISRYAFVAMPADGALDLNYIHNQTRNPNLNAGDGYFRNEGVGSWEINLAAFLADLNTNQWLPFVPPNNTYYSYNQPAGSGNSGHAFEDAYSLLTYRYNFNYNTLAVPAANFYNALVNYGVDGYSLGNLMTTTTLPFVSPPINGANAPWAGSDNTNHYFSISSDLFDTNKTAVGVISTNFTQRLEMAGNGVSTYDRYTFYRLLAQMGTDSAPEQNQINLNYSNAAAFYDANGMLTGTTIYPNAETNLVPWQPLQFFTIAADRMLREYSASWFQGNSSDYYTNYTSVTNLIYLAPSNYLATYYDIHTNYFSYIDAQGRYIWNAPNGVGLTAMLGVPNILGLTNDQVPSFGITNIPVLMNGQFVYSSAVNRILQLAANIYDATTTNFYPTRFRPLFTKVLTPTGVANVYVSRYVQQINSDFQFGQELNTASSLAASDIAPPMDVSDLPFGQNILTNVYGVPWIIGAKKGFPNFNEFTMENSIQVTRKLQFNRNTNTIPASGFTTNQMYLMGVTNFYGLECWNSYSNKLNYTGPTGLTGPIVIAVRNEAAMALTNQGGLTYIKQTTNYLTYTLNFWSSNEFILPLSTNDFLFTNAVYIYNNPGLHYFGNDSTNYADPGILPLPQFGLLVTNHLQVTIIDYSDSTPVGGQIIDYVQLNLQNTPRDINGEIADIGTTGLWSTNLVGGASSTLPSGVNNQIQTSRVGGTVPALDQGEGNWNPNLPQLPGRLAGLISLQQAQQLYFTAFFSSQNTVNYSSAAGNFTITNLSGSMQAPYTPTRTRVQRLTWQANDPLVHYLKSDLIDTADDTNSQHVVDWPSNLGYINNRYQPWGGNPNNPPNPNTPDDPRTANAMNPMVKDPLVTSSSAWDFPTNKFPTVGWLGRVHRGTPWQTVYLKASNILKVNNGINNWANWIGSSDLFNIANMAPIQDRLLFDDFSTALNDNATRGQLSVNMGANSQPSLAAWSALFSGIAVPTSLTNTYAIIDPAGAAGANSRLWQVVTNINTMRASFTNADGLVGSFEHVGDILSAPALTEQSPFLTGQNLTTGVSDAMMEWLPQQVMSLLRVDNAPRYVIYSYGQTLQPSPNGVATSGPNLANGTSPFGMVTNYQVTAETATRAVVQVNQVVTTDSNGYHTNYNTKIIQMNVLPPD